MQISRHWRMNANRYRLEGFALSSGEKALQPRQTVKNEAVGAKNNASERKTEERPAALAVA